MTSTNKKVKTIMDDPEPKQYVTFKKISENQIFCYFKTVMVAEIKRKSRSFYLYYQSSKLPENVKKEIEEKFSEFAD